MQNSAYYLPNFRLDNKKAMVTGASRGIGKALAIGLAEAGAEVFIIARTKDEILAVADEINQRGLKAIPIVADITNQQEINFIFSEIKELDILVNNAGMNI